MTPQATFVDIQSVITKMIAAGLSEQQHHPSMVTKGANRLEINISGAPDLSASLKKARYSTIYDDLLKAGAFNIRLIDGALIQMCYSFVGNLIESHRLSFFPSPTLEQYDLAPTLYEDDAEFADMMDIYSVRFPIRFDFSTADDEYVDVEHPKSHLTLGQYKNCRIPVAGPLSPTRFMRFITRNFYYGAMGRTELHGNGIPPGFPATISAKERLIAHLVA